MNKTKWRLTLPPKCLTPTVVVQKRILSRARKQAIIS